MDEHFFLRLWVLATGLAGLGAAVGAYLAPLSPHKTLYRRSAHTAHAEFARMYGTWLFTSTAVRVAFFGAAPAVGSALFWVTLWTYLVALVHFGTEIFMYRAAALRPGGTGPLVVASVSIAWFVKVAVQG